jgi:hypothetical protein
MDEDDSDLGNRKSDEETTGKKRNLKKSTVSLELAFKKCWYTKINIKDLPMATWSRFGCSPIFLVHFMVFFVSTSKQLIGRLSCHLRSTFSPNYSI